MKVQSLRIQNFRNVQRLELSNLSQAVLFLGPNGQGKTNLLESIFFTLKGKSFRPYFKSRDFFPVTSTENKASPVLCEVKIEASDARKFRTEIGFRSDGQRSSFFINQKKTSPTLLRERFPVVAFSPDDPALLRSGPDQRRDFLDEVFCDICPGYSSILSRFESALKQRNRLLKQIQAQKSLGPSRELGAWNEVFASASLELAQTRREFWPEYSKRLQELAERTMNNLLEPLSTRFITQLEDEYFQLGNIIRNLEESYARDLATGCTHLGPQRDDFALFLSGKEVKTTASQGQARILAFLLKWAHSEWIYELRGEYPVLVMDDFSSELDSFRRSRLLGLISEAKSQVFLSATDLFGVDLDALSEYTRMSVQRGVVLSENMFESARDFSKTTAQTLG